MISVKLADIQEAMLGYITEGRGLGLLESSLTARSRGRAPVYRTNYRQSLLKNLSHIYTVTQFILGDHYFNALCYQYIDDQASLRWDVNLYGDTFSAFIAEQLQRGELQPYPYLDTLTAIEYALHRAYYVDDEPTFSYDRLSDIPSDAHIHIQFILHDSIEIFETGYPVYTILDQYNQGEIGEHFAALSEVCYLIVYRDFGSPTLQPRLLQISLNRYRFLSYLKTGLTVGAILESVVDGGQLLAELPYLIEKGWISGMELNS